MKLSDLGEDDMEEDVPVAVGVRVCPNQHLQSHLQAQQAVQVNPVTNQLHLGSDKTFTFDYVYDSRTSQEDVYETSVHPLLTPFLDGYNVSVIGYGSSSSGKSYTLVGADLTPALNEQQYGILPRLVRSLFKTLELMPENKYSIQVSYIDIYNEEVRDLLSDNLESLDLKTDALGNPHLPMLSKVECYSISEVFACLDTGMSLHRTGGELPLPPSRLAPHATNQALIPHTPHSIVTIHLSQSNYTQGGLVMKSSRFDFVEVVGNDRLNSPYSGINLGLLALGNVVSALGDPRRNVSCVPYSDSLLTSLLAPALGGNCVTLFLCTVTTLPEEYEKSLNTLLFASTAANIRTNPTPNIVVQSDVRPQLNSQSDNAVDLYLQPHANMAGQPRPIHPETIADQGLTGHNPLSSPIAQQHRPEGRSPFITWPQTGAEPVPTGVDFPGSRSSSVIGSHHRGSGYMLLPRDANPHSQYIQAYPTIDNHTNANFSPSLADQTAGTVSHPAFSQRPNQPIVSSSVPYGQVPPTIGYHQGGLIGAAPPSSGGSFYPAGGMMGFYPPASSHLQAAGGLPPQAHGHSFAGNYDVMQNNRLNTEQMNLPATYQMGPGNIYSGAVVTSPVGTTTPGPISPLSVRSPINVNLYLPHNMSDARTISSLVESVPLPASEENRTPLIGNQGHLILHSPKDKQANKSEDNLDNLTWIQGPTGTNDPNNQGLEVANVVDDEAFRLQFAASQYKGLVAGASDILEDLREREVGPQQKLQIEAWINNKQESEQAIKKSGDITDAKLEKIPEEEEDGESEERTEENESDTDTATETNSESENNFSDASEAIQLTGSEGPAACLVGSDDFDSMESVQSLEYDVKASNKVKSSLASNHVKSRCESDITNVTSLSSDEEPTTDDEDFNSECSDVSDIQYLLDGIEVQFREETNHLLKQREKIILADLEVQLLLGEQEPLQQPLSDDEADDAHHQNNSTLELPKKEPELVFHSNNIDQSQSLIDFPRKMMDQSEDHLRNPKHQSQSLNDLNSKASGGVDLNSLMLPGNERKKVSKPPQDQELRINNLRPSSDDIPVKSTTEADTKFQDLDSKNEHPDGNHSQGTSEVKLRSRTTDSDNAKEVKAKLAELTSSAVSNREKIVQSEEDMDRLKHQLNDLKAVIRGKEALIRDLQAAGSESQTARLRLEQKLRKLERDARRSQREFMSAQALLNELKTRPDRSVLEDEYKERVKVYESELSRLHQRVKDTEQLLAVTQLQPGQLAELHDSLHMLREQHQQLKLRFHEEQRHKSELQLALDRDRETIRNLQLQLEATRLELSNSLKASKDLELEREMLAVEVARARSLQASREKLQELTLPHGDQIGCDHLVTGMLSRQNPAQMELQIRNQVAELRTIKEEMIREHGVLDERLEEARFLSPEDERRLVELDESIEAVDSAIDYKNDILLKRNVDYENYCGDNILLHKLVRLRIGETKSLLHKYFKRVLDLRLEGRKMEGHIEEVEEQYNELGKYVRDLGHALQRTKLESERKLVAQQRDYQVKINLLVQQLAEEAGGAGAGAGSTAEDAKRIRTLEKELHHYRKLCRELKREAKDREEQGRRSSDRSSQHLSPPPAAAFNALGHQPLPQPVMATPTSAYLSHRGSGGARPRSHGFSPTDDGAMEMEVFSGVGGTPPVNLNNNSDMESVVSQVQPSHLQQFQRRLAKLNRKLETTPKAIVTREHRKLIIESPQVHDNSRETKRTKGTATSRRKH